MLIALGMAEGVYKGHEQVPFWSSVTKEERKAMFGGGEEDEVPLGKTMMMRMRMMELLGV